MRRQMWQDLPEAQEHWHVSHLCKHHQYKHQTNGFTTTTRFACSFLCFCFLHFPSYPRLFCLSEALKLRQTRREIKARDPPSIKLASARPQITRRGVKSRASLMTGVALRRCDVALAVMPASVWLWEGLKLREQMESRKKRFSYCNHE